MAKDPKESAEEPEAPAAPVIEPEASSSAEAPAYDGPLTGPPVDIVDPEEVAAAEAHVQAARDRAAAEHVDVRSA